MIDYRQQAIRDVAAALTKAVSVIGWRCTRTEDGGEYDATRYAVALRERVLELEAELKFQKGANAAQDERERNAAKRLGMVHNCDWPDEVAERVLELKARLEETCDQLNAAMIGQSERQQQFERMAALCDEAVSQRDDALAQLQQKEGEIE